MIPLVFLDEYFGGSKMEELKRPGYHRVPSLIASGRNNHLKCHSLTNSTCEFWRSKHRYKGTSLHPENVEAKFEVTEKLNFSEH